MSRKARPKKSDKHLCLWWILAAVCCGYALGYIRGIEAHNYLMLKDIDRVHPEWSKCCDDKVDGLCFNLKHKSWEH